MTNDKFPLLAVLFKGFFTPTLESRWAGVWSITRRWRSRN